MIDCVIDFQTGGNLEELLFDIEALSRDIMDLQTQCTNSPTDNEANKKPYRSELNLVLSYNDEYRGSSDANSQVTPPVPAPMDLITPSSQINTLLLQHLPPPFPSIPTSPLTPPMNFKTNDMNPFDRIPDYSQLTFPPINAPVPAFTPNPTVFCTVSAPSTPASDRKCIEKFCINETNEPRAEKKKAKRVSIVNTKDEVTDKAPENQEVNNNDLKEAEKKPTENNLNHHSHMHRNHSHLHPKRRMSLDNNLVS